MIVRARRGRKRGGLGAYECRTIDDRMQPVPDISVSGNVGILFRII